MLDKPDDKENFEGVLLIMMARFAVIGILLLAAVATVPPYGFYGGTWTPSARNVELAPGKAGGSGAGGQPGRAGLDRSRRTVARDCRACGTQFR